MDSDKQPKKSSSEVDVARSRTDSSGESIGDSIDELESLITETKLPPKLLHEIPVLNDVVDVAEARRYAQTEMITKSIHNQADENDELPIVKLGKLVDSVDKKLSSELDALVDILKDTIKDSIIEELKEQLKKEYSQSQAPTAHADTSDKPSE